MVRRSLRKDPRCHGHPSRAGGLPSSDLDRRLRGDQGGAEIAIPVGKTEGSGRFRIRTR